MSKAIRTDVPLGAIVMVNCYRASSSHSSWCQRRGRHHVDLQLRGVVVYNESTDGKVIAYQFKPWWEAKQPRGREVYMQQIMPHYPRLEDIASVESETGGEKLRCGDEYSITHVDGTRTRAPKLKDE